MIFICVAKNSHKVARMVEIIHKKKKRVLFCKIGQLPPQLSGMKLNSLVGRGSMTRVSSQQGVDFVGWTWKWCRAHVSFPFHWDFSLRLFLRPHCTALFLLWIITQLQRSIVNVCIWTPRVCIPVYFCLCVWSTWRKQVKSLGYATCIIHIDRTRTASISRATKTPRCSPCFAPIGWDYAMPNGADGNSGHTAKNTPRIKQH